MSARANAVFRYIAYALEIILAYVLVNTPNLMPEICGSKPVLVICVALTAALFEREIPAMIIGMICGILADVGYSGGIGVFTISLAVVCFVVGYAANNLIVATFPNFLIYSLTSVGGLFMLYFLICFVWGGVEYRWTYFLNHILSRIIQTFIWSAGFYFLNRLVHNLLGEEK